MCRLRCRCRSPPSRRGPAGRRSRQKGCTAGRGSSGRPRCRPFPGSERQHTGRGRRSLHRAQHRRGHRDQRPVGRPPQGRCRRFRAQGTRCPKQSPAPARRPLHGRAGANRRSWWGWSERARRRKGGRRIRGQRCRAPHPSGRRCRCAARRRCPGQTRCRRTSSSRRSGCRSADRTSRWQGTGAPPCRRRGWYSRRGSHSWRRAAACRPAGRRRRIWAVPPPAGGGTRAGMAWAAANRR